MQIKFYDDFIIFKVVEMLVWIWIKTRFFDINSVFAIYDTFSLFKFKKFKNKLSVKFEKR